MRASGFNNHTALRLGAYRFRGQLKHGKDRLSFSRKTIAAVLHEERLRRSRGKFINYDGVFLRPTSAKFGLAFDSPSEIAFRAIRQRPHWFNCRSTGTPHHECNLHGTSSSTCHCANSRSSRCSAHPHFRIRPPRQRRQPRTCNRCRCSQADAPAARRGNCRTNNGYSKR